MRICVASQFSEGFWLAWKMQQEGHDVSAIVSDEHYAEALGGLITVMPGEEVYAAENYDLVVFDATGQGKDADEAREQVPTIGDSELADKLEEDRLFALDFMTRCGLQVAPYEAFDNPADGIRHIKKRDKRLVFKPIGEQDDKSTTYVSRDAKDMLRYFDVLFRSAKVSQYILQDFVEGVEASSEVYINQTGYYALNHTIETKKFLNNELGPNTGCSGSLCWMPRRDNPLFEKGLKKCIEPLQELGYSGPIDLNSILNPEGAWALEFTPRFGYDATALLTRLLPVGFGDFLYAIANEETVPDLTSRHPFCASVRLSIPPYPTDALPEKFYKAGVPIEGLTEEDLENFFIYDVRKRGESDDLETAGLCGWIGSPMAVGDTPDQAFDDCYKMLKHVRVPNGQYRTDVCVATCKRYYQLREHGYLK
jgi:phosphoribosylamine---glycine ligase